MIDARRRFLKRLVSLVAWPGLSTRVFSAPPEPAETPLQHALLEALGGVGWKSSGEVLLEIPGMAENGAIVPLTVESRIPDTRQILIFGEKNPGPLLVRFRFEPGTDAWVSVRVKLNESGRVLALAEAGGRWYGAEQPVRVMLGGCG